MYLRTQCCEHGNCSTFPKKIVRNLTYAKRRESWHFGNCAPLAALVELIAPYYPEGKNGRPPLNRNTHRLHR